MSSIFNETNVEPCKIRRKLSKNCDVRILGIFGFAPKIWPFLEKNRGMLGSTLRSHLQRNCDNSPVGGCVTIP